MTKNMIHIKDVSSRSTFLTVFFPLDSYLGEL